MAANEAELNILIYSSTIELNESHTFVGFVNINGDGASHKIRLAFGHETVRFIDSFGWNGMEWRELARMACMFRLV